MTEEEQVIAYMKLSKKEKRKRFISQFEPAPF